MSHSIACASKLICRDYVTAAVADSRDIGSSKLETKDPTSNDKHGKVHKCRVQMIGRSTQRTETVLP